MSTTPRILVIGSANVDLVATVPRSPKPGETITGTSFTTVAGGKGANQAVAAARLGAKTYFAGCVGADTFGELQRITLSSDGIDLTYLKAHPTAPTGTALIIVAETGQNSIVVVPSANSGILPEDIERMESLFREVDAVLLQLEIPMETVEAALIMAERTNTLSILDAGPAQRVPGTLLQRVSIVSPNESEAEAITGSSMASARQTAEHLREMGAREVVLKLGANGSFYLNSNESFHVPAFPVTAVDTTAAGDAFTAALACAWNMRTPREALRFANAAGALAATTLGAQPSMPTRTAVEAFLLDHKEE